MTFLNVRHNWLILSIQIRTRFVSNPINHIILRFGEKANIAYLNFPYSFNIGNYVFKAVSEIVEIIKNTISSKH